MSLLLWKNSNALKKPLILNLMKTHLTVIYFIVDLKNDLSQEQRLPSLWKGNIIFSLVAKLIFCYNWILTPLTLTDIKSNTLALNWQVGSWAHDRAASDFRFQFPRGGPCQGIPSFLRRVGSSIRSVPGWVRCPASVYFLVPQGCSITVNRYGHHRISWSARDPQGLLNSCCWPCTEQPQESDHVSECISKHLKYWQASCHEKPISNV